MSDQPGIAILGAGISGLVLASQLVRSGLKVTLLESSTRPGGVIRTAGEEGYLVESGPNSLQVNDPLIGDFLEECGLLMVRMY